MESKLWYKAYETYLKLAEFDDPRSECLLCCESNSEKRAKEILEEGMDISLTEFRSLALKEVNFEIMSSFSDECIMLTRVLAALLLIADRRQ